MAEQTQSSHGLSTDKTQKSGKSPQRSMKNVKSISRRTEVNQDESKHLMTAEEATRIVPDMPETCRVTFKTAKVLVWKELKVSVPMVGKQKFTDRLQFWKKADAKTMRKEVLHGVSGVAEPGEILAIMGLSGAGKSTLMNVLTQRNLKNLEIQGEITVNGESMALNEIQQMSSYVQQRDIFIGSVTVREHLILCARLRMGRRFSTKEKIERVDQVIDQMKLGNCQNALIGDAYKKSISLGEMKRLSFAAELLTDPSIIFCDEPTSGLDAFMAKQVIKALRDLAAEGKTIIITIHQPSTQVFNMFHKLCLMAIGQIIYLGPVKKVAGVFRDAGFPMVGLDNPADFFIEQLAVQDNETEEEMKERVLKIKGTYDDTNMAALYWHRIHGEVSERRKKLGNEDVRKANQYGANWIIQLLWLTVRSFLTTIRNPSLLKIRLAHVLITSIMIGVVYLQLGAEPEEDKLLSYNGILFGALRDNIFMFMFPCLTVFTEEMPVLLRENHGNIYRIDTYFIGKNLAELPQYIILPIIYSIVVFYMSGIMNYTTQFFVFAAVNVLVCNLAIGIGYCAGCVFGTAELASQILPILTLPLMIFSGYFVSLNALPSWIKWLQYVSYHRYAFESQMSNMWQTLDCSNKTTPTLMTTSSPPTEYMCSNGTQINGTKVLESYGLSTGSHIIPMNIGVLLAFNMFFRCICVFALYIRTRFFR